MRELSLLFILIACSFFSGCYDMRYQPKFETYEETEFFADGRSARPLVDGTVARGFLREDDHMYKGKINGHYADTFPFPIDEKILKRGQERYNIYCSVCHDHAGYGRGMVVQRGFKQPPTYHDERMRNMPAGYFYEVIGQGFGVMAGYAAQIKPEDRWAIAAYIRALQYSQNAPFSAAPRDEQNKLASILESQKKMTSEKK